MKNSKIILSSLIACICEGGAEKTIIDILLDNNLLIFNRNQLLEESTLSCRGTKEFENRYLKKSFNNKISVIRILDSRSEQFNVSKAYKHKIDVINIITAPEIEMLIIINENMYNEYCKVSSKKKPSQFCKEILKYKNVKSPEFIKDYFKDPKTLVNSINEYKRIKNIKNNELCLSDILN